MSDTTSTSTTTITSASAVIDRYLDAYGQSDSALRRELIADAFSDDATLADPPFETSGHAGLDATFAAVQAQFPGNSFRRTSGVEGHHDWARYDWELVAPDGTVSVAGTDTVRFAPDGRIAAVVGFFGAVPVSSH